MKIKLLTTLAGPELTADRDSVIVVGDDLAKQLIEANAAIAVDSAAEPQVSIEAETRWPEVKAALTGTATPARKEAEAATAGPQRKTKSK